MRYLIDGVEYAHVGHCSDAFFMVKTGQQVNKVIEIPWTFDGIIFKKEEEKVQ